MKRLLIIALLGSLFAAPSFAGGETPNVTTYTTYDRYVLHRPCVRGPFPRVRLINGASPEFIAFLRKARPEMPQRTAEQIAGTLCANLTLVGRPDDLSRHLNILISAHGY